jgi:hypothetical protein
MEVLVGGTCARMGEKINPSRILVGKLEGKKPLVRHSSRWEGSVNTRLTETELDECGSG